MKPSAQETQSAPIGPLEAEIEVAEAIGRLMHFWGFKRPMGRIWSVLYLSPKPISAAELGSSLKMSAGAVSMALSELEKWGAVTRHWVPGDRKDYFVAEDSIWKLVQRVIKERELSLVKDFSRALHDADERLSALHQEDSEALAEQISYKRERLRHLNSLSDAGTLLLTALVEGDTIDPTPFLRKPE